MEQKSRKRLSILKKATGSNESSPTFTKIGRRISFSQKKNVKEFITDDDKMTIWGSSYEESTHGHIDTTENASNKHSLSNNTNSTPSGAFIPPELKENINDLMCPAKVVKRREHVFATIKDSSIIATNLVHILGLDAANGNSSDMDISVVQVDQTASVIKSTATVHVVETNTASPDLSVGSNESIFNCPSRVFRHDIDTSTPFNFSEYNILQHPSSTSSPIVKSNTSKGESNLNLYSTAKFNFDTNRKLNDESITNMSAEFINQINNLDFYDEIDLPTPEKKNEASDGKTKLYESDEELEITRTDVTKVNSLKRNRAALLAPRSENEDNLNSSINVVEKKSKRDYDLENAEPCSTIFFNYENMDVSTVKHKDKYRETICQPVDISTDKTDSSIQSASVSHPRRTIVFNDRGLDVTIALPPTTKAMSNQASYAETLMKGVDRRTVHYHNEPLDETSGAIAGISPINQHQTENYRLANIQHISEAVVPVAQNRRTVLYQNENLDLTHERSTTVSNRRTIYPTDEDIDVTEIVPSKPVNRQTIVFQNEHLDIAAPATALSEELIKNKENIFTAIPTSNNVEPCVSRRTVHYQNENLDETNIVLPAIIGIGHQLPLSDQSVVNFQKENVEPTVVTKILQSLNSPLKSSKPIPVLSSSPIHQCKNIDVLSKEELIKNKENIFVPSSIIATTSAAPNRHLTYYQKENVDISIEPHQPQSSLKAKNRQTILYQDDILDITSALSCVSPTEKLIKNATLGSATMPTNISVPQKDAILQKENMNEFTFSENQRPPKRKTIFFDNDRLELTLVEKHRNANLSQSSTITSNGANVGADICQKEESQICHDDLDVQMVVEENNINLIDDFKQQQMRQTQFVHEDLNMTHASGRNITSVEELKQQQKRQTQYDREDLDMTHAAGSNISAVDDRNQQQKRQTQFGHENLDLTHAAGNNISSVEDRNRQSQYGHAYMDMTHASGRNVSSVEERNQQQKRQTQYSHVDLDLTQAAGKNISAVEERNQQQKRQTQFGHKDLDMTHASGRNISKVEERNQQQKRQTQYSHEDLDMTQAAGKNISAVEERNQQQKRQTQFGHEDLDLTHASGRNISSVQDLLRQSKRQTQFSNEDLDMTQAAGSNNSSVEDRNRQSQYGHAYMDMTHASGRNVSSVEERNQQQKCQTQFGHEDLDLTHASGRNVSSVEERNQQQKRQTQFGYEDLNLTQAAGNNISAVEERNQQQKRQTQFGHVDLNLTQAAGKNISTVEERNQKQKRQTQFGHEDLDLTHASGRNISSVQDQLRQSKRQTQFGNADLDMTQAAGKNISAVEERNRQQKRQTQFGLEDLDLTHASGRNISKVEELKRQQKRQTQFGHEDLDMTQAAGNNISSVQDQLRQSKRQTQFGNEDLDLTHAARNNISSVQDQLRQSKRQTQFGHEDLDLTHASERNISSVQDQLRQSKRQTQFGHEDLDLTHASGRNISSVQDQLRQSKRQTQFGNEDLDMTQASGRNISSVEDRNQQQKRQMQFGHEEISDVTSSPMQSTRYFQNLPLDLIQIPDESLRFSKDIEMSSPAANIPRHESTRIESRIPVMKNLLAMTSRTSNDTIAVAASDPMSIVAKSPEPTKSTRGTMYYTDHGLNVTDELSSLGAIPKRTDNKTILSTTGNEMDISQLNSTNGPAASHSQSNRGTVYCENYNLNLTECQSKENQLPMPINRQTIKMEIDNSELSVKDDVPPHNVIPLIYYHNQTLDITGADHKNKSHEPSSLYSPNSTEVLCNLDPSKIMCTSNDDYIRQSPDKSRLSLENVRKLPTNRDFSLASKTFNISPRKSAAARRRTEDFINITLGRLSNDASDIDNTSMNLMSNSISEIDEKLNSFQLKYCDMDSNEEVKLPENQRLREQLRNRVEPSLNTDGWKLFEGYPTMHEILDVYNSEIMKIRRREPNVMGPVYGPAKPSSQFLINNYADERMKEYEKNHPPKERSLGAFYPHTPKIQDLIKNKLAEMKSDWTLDDTFFYSGVLIFSHARVATLEFLLIFDFTKKRDFGEIRFKEIKTRLSKTKLIITTTDLLRHVEYLKKLPRNLNHFCRASNEIFQFLTKLDGFFESACRIVARICDIVIKSRASLKRNDNNGKMWIEKNYYIKQKRKIYKISVKLDEPELTRLRDFTITPTMEYTEAILSLKDGLDLVEEILCDSEKYINFV